MEMQNMELVFVYNAKADLFSKVSDFAHKVIAPSSYQCSLCSLTHGNMGPRKEWISFLDKIDTPVKFLYKDQVSDTDILKFGQSVILLKSDKHEITELVSKNKIKEIKNIEVLIALVEKELKRYGKNKGN